MDKMQPAPMLEVGGSLSLRPVASVISSSNCTWEIDWLIQKDREWVVKLLVQMNELNDPTSKTEFVITSDADLKSVLDRQVNKDALTRMLVQAQARKHERTGPER